MKINKNCPYRKQAKPNKRLATWFNINGYYICFIDGKACVPEIERKCPQNIQKRTYEQ